MCLEIQCPVNQHHTYSLLENQGGSHRMRHFFILVHMHSHRLTHTHTHTHRKRERERERERESTCSLMKIITSRCASINLVSLGNSAQTQALRHTFFQLSSLSLSRGFLYSSFSSKCMLLHFLKCGGYEHMASSKVVHSFRCQFRSLAYLFMSELNG